VSDYKKDSYNLISDKEDVINLRKRSQKANELALNYLIIRNKSDDTQSPFVEKAREAWDGERLGMKLEARKKGMRSKLLLNNEHDFIRRNGAEELSKEVLKVSKRANGGLKLLGKSLPIIGAAITGAAALSSPDAGAAAIDFLVPGGVESMGVSDEQKQLDKMYKMRIQQRREELNNIQ
jgi:hypothetical protein